MRSYLFFLLSTLLISTSPAYAQYLTGAEIKAAFSGKLLKWRSADGKYKGTVTYLAGGHAVMTGNLIKARADTGKWYVKGNSICAEWKIVLHGIEKCRQFRSTGPKAFVDQRGVHYSY